MNNNHLYNDKYVPVTDGYGFLGATLENVSGKLFEWQKGLWPTRQRTSHCGSLDAALEAMQPLNSDATLIIETQSRWTAVFVSYGSFPMSEISVLSKEMQVEGLVVNAVEDTFIPASNEGRPGGGSNVLF